ncbi:MAG: hypothetical protein JW809_05345 [Pirellulales bacterium]|nr:hypothetical protein [Pirellulales bacterium]
MPRTLQAAASFAIVLVAYCGYRLLAVPLIEPSRDAQRARVVSSREIDEAEARPQRRVEEFAWLFPPGAWELNNPKIVQSDRVTLLVGQYTTEPDGQVRLIPCTIIFTPGSPDDPPEARRRRTVVLQAPEGALMRFDEPFDLGRATIGRLIGGRLIGEITLRGAGDPNDPSDDLAIATREIQLTERHMWTRHPVAFRLGPHFGQGREMHFQFAPSEADGGGRDRSPQVGNLESFELVHVDRLHLEIPDDQVAPGATPAADPAAQKTTLPVDVACQGPFVFNIVHRQATFHDRVSVIRSYPDGPGDSLTANTLTVHFIPRRDKAKKDQPPPGGPATTATTPPASPAPPDDPSNSPGLLELEPARLEAQGQPVVIQSPRDDAYAQGEHLDYDLITGRIALDGRQTVFLRRGSNQCQAVSLEYQPPAPGWSFGSLAAAGPGWFRGLMDDRPDQAVEARWNRELRLQPHEKNQVLSLTGGAVLDYSGVGHMSANEIHFFMNEIPPKTKADRPTLAPDRMRADGDVQLDSPRLSGTVDELRVWFKPDPNAPGGFRPQVESSGGGASASAGAPRGPGPNAPGGDAPGSNPAAPGPGGPDSPPAANLPTNHFQLNGRVLEVEIALVGGRADVANLTVRDHVRLVETRTRSPDEQPIEIQGDRIEVQNASAPHAAASVTGRPAQFRGRGLGLFGANISLNYGTNKLWINGPGAMDLPPLARDLQGRPVRGGGPLRVDWQGRMDFDGRTAHFEKSVVAASQLQQLRTDALDASFRQMIRFSEAAERTDPDVEVLTCQGGVRMDSRAFEGNELVSVESVETKDLSINNLTGAIHAAGPGWLQSTRKGAGPLGTVPGPNLAAIDSAAANPPDEITYLHVVFQGSITGDVHRHEVTFHDRVRAVFGPVPTWQSTLPDDDPDALGDRGAQLGCEHLTVVEMPSPTGGESAAELSAAGNARIEGRQFTAWGNQVTYDQRKGLLILKGDGPNDATLSYQTRVGGPETSVSGQEFYYWPATQRVSGSGLHSFEMDQFNVGAESKR